MSGRRFAFLRAINVGGRTVRMNELRALFEEMGLAGVSTFIASGNVIFDAGGETTPHLESRIERHLESRLGYEVATFIRSTGDLKGLQRDQPFDGAEVGREGHRLHVAFLRDEPGRQAIDAVRALGSATDSLEVMGRHIFWLSRTSMRESPVSGAVIEKSIGGPATLRNINTIDRLVAKYGGSAD